MKHSLLLIAMMLFAVLPFNEQPVESIEWDSIDKEQSYIEPSCREKLPRAHIFDSKFLVLEPSCKEKLPREDFA